MTLHRRPQSRLGMLLSSLRRQAHLRREQLAHLAGISADSLQLLEQGRTDNPTAKTLIGLSRSLDVPVVELLDCIAEDLEAEGNM